MKNFDFQNNVIDTSSIPQVLEDNFVQVEKSYKKILQINLGLEIITFVALLIALHFIPKLEIAGYYFVIAAVAIVVYAVLRMLLIWKSFPIKGYQIREKDISYKSGLLNFKMVTVTFNRIQHVEIKQSFLLKLFKLANVKIFTAGGSSSDLSIPGLSHKKAEEIKAFLSRNIADYE